METCQTVTCMIAMTYNETVITFYYFHGIELVLFELSFSKFIKNRKVFSL